MTIRKGEPAEVSVRVACMLCGDEQYRGRKWWRKNLKGLNDNHRYAAISQYICGPCLKQREQMAWESKRVQARQDAEAVEAVKNFFIGLGLREDGFPK